MKRIRLCITGRLFFWAALFPFVSPVPIGSDLQPMVIVLGIAFLSYYYLLIGIKISEAILILLSVLVFLVLPLIIGFEVFGSEYVSKYLALISAVILFFSFRYPDFVVSERVLKSAVLIYFLFTVFILVDSTSAYAIQSLIVRNINSITLGYRGVSTFATEPGLLASLLISFLLYFDWIEERVGRHNLFYRVVVCLLIVLTKSGTGVLLLGFYLLFRYSISISLKRLSFFLLFLMASVFFVLVFSVQIERGDFGRGGQLLYSLVFSPSQFFSDSSFLYRVYALFVGVLSGLSEPLGVGASQVASQSDSIVANSSMLSSFYEKSRYGFRAVSSFGYYSTLLGLMFMIPVILIVYYSKATLLRKSFAGVYMFFSLSIAFPAIWLLLNLGKPKKCAD